LNRSEPPTAIDPDLAEICSIVYTGFGIAVELRFDSVVRREVIEEEVVVEMEGRLDEADSLSTTSTTAHVPVLLPSLDEVE
jgi:hypothetical protein